MRILTVRQPWAWAIIHGGKTVENRIRNIAGGYRGPVAIHAGLTIERETVMPLDAVVLADRRPVSYPTGAIIGVVDLVDVHPGTRHGEALATWTCTGSPWAETGAWHLVLANPRSLAEPIPYRGALGLRTLDVETVARIEAVLS